MGVWRVLGKCLEDVCRVSRGCLDGCLGIFLASGWCLKGFWSLYGWYLEGANRVLVGCLEGF